MLTSCQNQYFEDSGIHDPFYGGTIMDFVKGRPDIFDSLYRVIQLSGLESELNKENVTFFAPGDASIRQSIYMLNQLLYELGQDTVMTMDQVDPAIWREYLSMYIYGDVYLLKDIPQIDTLNMNIYPGQGFESLGGHSMNLGVNYNDVVSENANGQEQRVKYAGYRQLFISYVRDVSNIGQFGAMVNSPVATSDIRTLNGVIHALEYRRHEFGFDAIDFALSAYTRGIIYKN